jgi:hypothetical protein
VAEAFLIAVLLVADELLDQEVLLVGASFYEVEVGVRAGVAHDAGLAAAAGLHCIRFVCRAEESFGELLGEGARADAHGADKEVGGGEAVRGDAAAESLDDFVVTLEALPHGEDHRRGGTTEGTEDTEGELRMGRGCTRIWRMIADRIWSMTNGSGRQSSSY